MTYPVAHSSSDSARLMVDAPGFAVGWQQPIYLPNPAAGAQWTRKTDGRYFERLIAVTFTLTADAVVANRVPSLVLADSNGKVITTVPAGGTVVASTVLTTFLSRNAPAFAAAAVGNAYGYLPDLMTPPDWSWSSVVAGMDAADQISGVTLLVQQFPNDAAIITAGQ